MTPENAPDEAGGDATPDSVEPEAPSTSSRVADAASIASDFGVVWIAVAVAQVLLRRATPLNAARRLGFAGVASLVLTRWLKHHFAVPRTELDEGASTLARTPTSDRFPSGHTLTAFVAALTIPTRPVGRALAVAFATLVAWARVRVGHHRAVDVVAGAAVGILAGSALAAALPSSSTA